MALMLRFMALILAMIMLFSGVACGYNLLLGGINQNEPCVEPCSSAANDDYKKIAASLDAYYFPMYYKDQGSNIEEVRKAALGEASEQNGLENGALKNHHYETIVAYSGGTSTAITSLADKTKYGLTCDKLVLISPMAAGIRLDIPETSGASPEGDLVINVLQIAADIEIAKLNFKKQIDNIRANNPNIKIIVIQSPDDKPSLLSNTYQYWFDGKDPGIEVHEADLTKTGEDAHKEIFFNYAASHLANDGSGITFSTTGQSTKPNPFEQSSANQEPQFPASSQPSETAPVAADVNSIGTLQSDVKFIKTTTPTSQILSNLNIEQGTTQTASQSTNAKSANVASSPSPNVQQAIDNMEPVGEYNHYESTIPIPIGPAADALKAQGKYEEYLENALQAAEDRTAQNSQDGDAWYTKGLALHYLNRDEEANVALAQAKELGIQFESNGESFTRVGQTEPTTQATETTKSADKSNTEESTVIPTLYPVTSPPPDESVNGVPVAADVPSVGIPQNAEEWNSRGIALLNQGNYKEAQKAFKESAFLDNNPVAWKNYWDIYYNHDEEDLTAEKHKEQKASQSSETIPIAADVNSIGTPQSDVKFIKTSTPTSKILSNLNLEQGTTQTTSQSTNAKSANVASSPSPNVQQAIDNMEPGEYNHYESTIPIPIGPAADALKAQGKYEEYLENALQAAEDRTAQDSQDGDAWYTKGLALHYLNRDEEANVAFAQAKKLGIQFESNGESFTRVGQAEPTTQATETTKPTDESNTEESTVIPTLYPVTSPPPDESNTEESSTTSQSTDTKFGDTKLSVTQPVDPQPDLAFGQIFKNNQQMATSSSEPADKQSSKFYVISSNNLDTIETLESIKESNLYFGKGSPKSTTSTYANKNTQTYTLPAPVTSTAAQGSENSVVGTWNIVCDTPTQAGVVSFTVTFNRDGTLNMPSVHREKYNIEGGTGRWTQKGDSIRWEVVHSTVTSTFEGTIQMNNMNGMVLGRSWSAERA